MKLKQLMSLITAFLDSFLYTSLPGFYLKKKRVQSTKTKLFHHSSWQSKEAVICNFFSSEKKVVESVATFDVSLLCPSKLSLLHNLQDKQEKGKLAPQLEYRG